MSTEIERSRTLYRHQQSIPATGIPPGCEWWTDNPHLIAARVAKLTRRGEIVEINGPAGRTTVAPGVVGTMVRRLKRPRPRWIAPCLIGAGGSLVILAVLMILAEIVKGLIMLWPLLLTLVIVMVGVRFLSGHRATCTGMHCPGCRG